MNWKTIHHSPRIRKIIITLGIIVVLLIVFKLGELYGYHRAGFSRRFGDSFHRNFIDPDRRGPGKFFDEGIPNGHGAVGKVVSVALPKLTVAGPDNLEKVVVTDDNTLVREFRTSATLSDITPGDNLIVIGDPNANGEIQARLIRILPADTTATTLSPQPSTTH